MVKMGGAFRWLTALPEVNGRHPDVLLQCILCRQVLESSPDGRKRRQDAENRAQ